MQKKIPAKKSEGGTPRELKGRTKNEGGKRGGKGRGSKLKGRGPKLKGRGSKLRELRERTNIQRIGLKGKAQKKKGQDSERQVRNPNSGRKEKYCR